MGLVRRTMAEADAQMHIGVHPILHAVPFAEWVGDLEDIATFSVFSFPDSRRSENISQLPPECREVWLFGRRGENIHRVPEGRSAAADHEGVAPGEEDTPEDDGRS